MRRAGIRECVGLASVCLHSSHVSLTLLDAPYRSLTLKEDQMGTPSGEFSPL